MTKNKATKEKEVDQPLTHPTFQKILASENEGLQTFGKFNLCQSFGLNYSDTIIQYDEYIIASGRDGKIHIYSKVHKTHREFVGAGGECCVQLMVRDDVLYQVCSTGKLNGILMYKLDQVDLDKFMKHQKQDKT